MKTRLLPARIFCYFLILTFIQTATIHFSLAQSGGAKAEKAGLTFSRFPTRFTTSSPFTPDQKLLLRFDQSVDVNEIGRQFSFYEKSEKQAVPSKASRPSLEEIRSFGSWLLSSEISEVDQKNLQKRFVLIEPSSRLKVGKSWYLSVADNGVVKSPGLQILDSLSPFTINSISTVNPYDGNKRILVYHGKRYLSPEFDAEKMAQHIEVTPAPENMKLSVEQYRIWIDGDFEFDKKYTVKVASGIVARDRISLLRNHVDSVTFKPNQGFVNLPVMSSTQNAAGKGTIEVKTANLKAIRSRVKKLEGDSLIYTMKGFAEAYKGSGSERGIPFSMVNGKTIYDKTRERTAEYDKSETFDLKWSEINPDAEYGSYYICVDGESDTRSNRTLGAHALVQVTDIGLVWKQSDSETLIYAFSIATGEPKSGMPVRLLTDESETVAEATTDKQGVAKFPVKAYGDKELWLDARFEGDRYTRPFSKKIDKVGLWSFNIPSRSQWDEPEQRRTLIFTDRDVYKPGETVYIKCLTRTIDSDRILPVQPGKAQLQVFDQKRRKLLDKSVTFSKNGSFHEQFTLPELGLGHHSIKLDFNDPEDPDNHKWNLVKRHYFNVAEYKPNTFEISLETKDIPTSEESVSVPLSAKYYMGKPLSKAKVTWNAYVYNQFPNPDGFAEFDFGDRYQDRNGYSANDETSLGDEGKANIKFDINIDPESPAPQHVSLTAEVTDINQQTISKQSGFTVHSSDFYIGLRKPEGVFRVGDAVPFAIANIDPNGKIYTRAADTEITVEKEIWTTVKVKGSNGRIVHRNERHLEHKSNETVSVETRVDPSSQLPLAQTHHLEFDEAGDYVITLESEDDEGRRVLTRERFRVIGMDQPSWSRHDVVAIDVVPDRKSYRVGDTAKLLVRSPVFGKALITTERGDVKTVQSLDITKHETVIDVPIEPGAAPNLFASVLIVRGSEDSPHKHPTAVYRLGYCQLDIDDPSVDLSVIIDTGGEDYYIPGRDVKVSALVTDSEGQSIPGAEVTFFAVDEGVLSLTNYDTPDPGKTFNEAFPLSVMMGQSLSNLLPENPLERYFGNKGYVIGGGGHAEDSLANLDRVRKDFKALVFWKPDLVTDENGRVSHTIKVPDNLTTFRVMAVVNKGNRFGSADAPFVVNKPLIIEPALPRFSNLSDQIDLTAVLHNNTEKAHQLEVEVSLDEHAVFVNRLGEVLPTNLSNLPEDSKYRKSLITVQPGATEVLHFPVAMTKTGDSKWDWKVRSLDQKGLVDATESKLSIGYPLPLLKSSKNYVLREADVIQNLLHQVEDRLLDGNGVIEVSVSNSRVIEAADALDYLLTYPYGCVEQTTSTTLPWLSTKNIREAFPDLNVSEDKITSAIAKGTKRLLSMQTSDGGLSYWPGENESILWGSAYGGLALALAQKEGADLPKDQLDQLWNYLSKNLRNIKDLTRAYDLSQRCLAAYTLAVAGKPEESYHDVLFERWEELPREGRALLALAMVETRADDSRVEKLLTTEPSANESKVRWYKKPYFTATELMAWTKYKIDDPKTDERLNELMNLKRPGRGWGSTYSNSWPLMALAAHAESSQHSFGSNQLKLEFGDRIETFKFGGTLHSKTIRIPFEGDRRQIPLHLHSESSSPVYANVKVATQPKLLPMEPEDHGFSVKRKYQKVDPDGTLHAADQLQVGDLVLVRLDVNIAENNEDYIAIDDPLPAILETINPSFDSQATRSVKKDTPYKKGGPKRLWAHYRELRKDRTLFFANYVHRAGDYYVEYLTRVVAPGDAIAPPAKVEAMYEPERFGLSGTSQLSSRSLNFKEKKVAMRY